MKCKVQSNSVNTDTEGTMEKGPYKRGVRIKPVEFRENIRAFFPQGQSKLSIKMRCLYYAGVRRKARFDYMEQYPTREDSLLAPNITFIYLLFIRCNYNTW